MEGRECLRAAEVRAEDKVAATEARIARIHKLGNLTLVTTPMNSSLSNGKWAAKRKQLGKGSKLLLNAEIIDSYPESFDEGFIDARTALLAERIRDIWRGPSDPAWVV